MGLVLPGRVVHAVQDRPDPERRRVDRGVGRGVRRGAGLRLLLVLSALSTRVRCAAPVLPGAPDPRCEVPDDPAGCTGSGLWRGAARGVTVVVRGDPPARGAVRDGVPGPTGSGACGGDAPRDTGGAGDPTQPQPGEAVRGARGELFPVRHDSG